MTPSPQSLERARDFVKSHISPTDRSGIPWSYRSIMEESIAALIDRVRAEERERAAKIAETSAAIDGSIIASAIRQSGESAHA